MYFSMCAQGFASQLASDWFQGAWSAAAWPVKPARWEGDREPRTRRGTAPGWNRLAAVAPTTGDTDANFFGATGSSRRMEP